MINVIILENLVKYIKFSNVLKEFLLIWKILFIFLRSDLGSREKRVKLIRLFNFVKFFYFYLILLVFVFFLIELWKELLFW